MVHVVKMDQDVYTLSCAECTYSIEDFDAIESLDF